MNAKKILSSVGVLVVGVGVVLGFKYYNKSKSSAEVKQQAIEIVNTLPDHERNKDYYDGLIEFAHPAAFDSSYRMGGRRTSAKFDDEKYLGLLSDLMIKKANSDQRSDVAGYLEGACRKLGVTRADLGK